MFWKNDSSYEDVAVIEYMDTLYIKKIPLDKEFINESRSNQNIS